MKDIVIHSVHHTILQRTHREHTKGTHHYKELNVYKHSIYVYIYIYIYIYERDSPSHCTPYNPSKDTSLQGALQGTHQYKELYVCINYFKVYNFKEYYDIYILCRWTLAQQAHCLPSKCQPQVYSWACCREGESGPLLICLAYRFEGSL